MQPEMTSQNMFQVKETGAIDMKLMELHKIPHSYQFRSNSNFTNLYLVKLSSSHSLYSDPLSREPVASLSMHV